MGICVSRSNVGSVGFEYDEKDVAKFVQKMRILQQEVKAILKQREEESLAYEREVLLMAFKEAKWKKERKKLRDDVKRLRKKLEERKERIRAMEDERKKKVLESEGEMEVERCTIGRLLLADQRMREERAMRDEAVEKWKMLYLAIKNELDDLIQKTQEGTICKRRAEDEELIDDLHKDLKVKNETIQLLKARIASMEDDEYKKKREMDILRQSLKIMGKRGTDSSLSIVKSRSESLHLGNLE